MGAVFDQLGDVLSGVFDNPLVRLFMTAFTAYIVVLWLACAFWVLNDMRRRHREPAVPFIAAAAMVVASPVLFPLALIVYRIVRPGETLAEARERELTERLEELDAELDLACPGCSASVEEDWLVCPVCRTKLAHRCANCGRTMGLDWTLCGWCGSEFGQPVRPESLPSPRRRPWGRERPASTPEIGERAFDARA
jgi:RNA polymerase subunit RPABC4/transcription elongation factor Spt4